MPENNDKRLFLLDAMALIYRAYYAMIRNPLINSRGLNTSAIQGFTNTLFELIRKDEPTHIAVVFDTFAPTNREQEFADYKANREETPKDIVHSLPYIRQIIEAFNIPILELDGYEADDIIGTMAKIAEQDSYETYMVTSDKDFGQLVSDKIFIYKPPYQGKGGFQKIGPEEVIEKWDIKRVEQVIDVLGLMGDKVDNIPGVPGIGAKTAAKLLAKYDSVEGIIEHLDELKGKQKETFEEFQEQALACKRLATIETEVPVKWDEEDLVMSEPDKEALTTLFNELEFRNMGKRILGEEYQLEIKPESSQMDLFGGEVQDHQDPDELSMDSSDHDYYLIEGKKAINDLVKKLAAADEVCFDTETSGISPITSTIVGMSFSIQPGVAYYVPVPEDEAQVRKIVKSFQPLFADKKKLKIAQNVKFDMLMLRKYGVDVAPPIFDTMIAHYLIEPDLRHSMDYLAETYLGYHPMKIESLIGKKGKNQGSMRDLEPAQIKDYAAEDADITLRLKQLFEPQLKERNVEKLFFDIEVPLVHVLADMEHEGIHLDVQFLNDFSQDLKTDITKLQQQIHELAGETFNIDSTQQLAKILFSKLEIPYKGRKTKTGRYSTNEDVLSKLADEYEIAARVLDYRELVKLKSTYVDALPDLVNKETNRIHTTFNQTVANTGRLSSANPNLQNIPIRTERGRQVRKAFIPRSKDYVIVSADYSQVELRIIAALSNDEKMKAAFKAGEDIHTSTAAKVFDVPSEAVDRNMRSKAKAVNFGIAYGQTAFGLSQSLNISRQEATEIIENYFRKFPGVKKYMDDSIAFAREHGYAKTILSRRRYLKDINSNNSTVRGFAERNAINMPIQGSAADMIKLAMISIHHEMNRQNYQSKMVLQVHDELVFDAKKSELDTLLPLIEEKMKTAVDLGVPIDVEIGKGKDWLEAH